MTWVGWWSGWRLGLGVGVDGGQVWGWGVRVRVGAEGSQGGFEGLRTGGWGGVLGGVGWVG